MTPPTYPKFTRAALGVLLAILAFVTGFAVGVRTLGQEFDFREPKPAVCPEPRPPCECRCFVDVPDSPPCPRPW
jgi:hypothetical protein